MGENSFGHTELELLLAYPGGEVQWALAVKDRSSARPLGQKSKRSSV